jgi:PAS domain S-box-containing protein
LALKISTKFISVLTIGLAVFFGLISYSIWQDYGSSISNIKRQVENQTLILSEHAVQSFNGILLTMDAALSQIEVVADGNPGPTSGNIKRFKALTDSVPQIRNLVAFRRDGFDAFSNTGKSRGFQLADRNYFKVQINDTSHDIHIDEPIVGRSTGRNFVPVSHRITGPKGRFDGILMAVVDQSYFSELYRSTEKREQISSALVSSSGNLFAWSDNFLKKTVDGKIPSIRDTKLFAEIAGENRKGIFVGSILDPNDIDVISYAKIANSAYTIVSRLDRNSALIPWRQNAILLVCLGIIASAGLFWSAFSTFNQVGLREQAEYALRVANENLELTVEKRTVELRHSENQLVQAEERLLDAINSLPLNFSLYDADERLILTNRKNIYWIDQPSSEVIGKRAEDILRSYVEAEYYPAALGREEEYIAERMAQFRNHDAPATIEFSDGRIVELTYCKTSDGGTVGIRRDITKQTATQTENKRLADAINSISDGVLMFDNKDEFVFANEQFFDQSPVFRDIAVPGTSFEKLIRTAAEAGSNLNAVGREEEWIQSRLERHAKHEGTEFLKLPDGRILMVKEYRTPDQGTLIIRTDITEQRHADEEIRKLSSAVEQNPSMVIITNAEGIIEYVNPKFTEISGYTAAESIGQKPSLLKSGATPRETYRELWETIGNGREWHGEFLDRRRDGTTFWASVSIKPIKNDANKVTHYLSMEEDITGRKKREMELREAQEQAEIANRTKSEFLANMSHELRTPLNAIIGFSDAIKSETFGPLENETYKDYINDIQNSGQHLLNLINDLLDVSVIEAGKLELQESEVDLEKTVDASLQMVRSRADFEGIKLTNSIHGEAPVIHADELRMKQILVNLLSNAVKFTQVGGSVSVSTRIAEDNSALIKITDTGIGMDAEELSNAMEKFGQANRGDLMQSGEGTGLGLPLTKGLIEAHGGMLEIESQRNKGTTVTIRIPGERIISNA